MLGYLSFTFVTYLTILVYIFKVNQLFTKERYKNKVIDNSALISIQTKLPYLMDSKLYLNPNLSLADLADEMKVPLHTLSQFLNENEKKSFPAFINQFRIEEAKRLLVTKKNYTIESVGYESGFKSKSTFYSTFKKLTGQTPAEYQKSVLI